MLYKYKEKGKPILLTKRKNQVLFYNYKEKENEKERNIDTCNIQKDKEQTVCLQYQET